MRKIIPLILIFPLFCFSGEITKVGQSKIIATVDNYPFEGDVFYIKDSYDKTRGKAKVLKVKNNKALLKFNGDAEVGWQVVDQNQEEKRSIASVSMDDELDEDQLIQQDYTSISTGQYIAGGVVGIMLGMGIGHAVQGRYSRTGWIFTVGQLASGITFGVYFAQATIPSQSSNVSQTDNFGLIFSAVALVGFRIWELIDVWWLPSSYKITVKNDRENQFILSPTILYSKYNSQISDPALGLSMSFKW